MWGIFLMANSSLYWLFILLPKTRKKHCHHFSKLFYLYFGMRHDWKTCFGCGGSLWQQLMLFEFQKYCKNLALQIQKVTADCPCCWLFCPCRSQHPDFCPIFGHGSTPFWLKECIGAMTWVHEAWQIHGQLCGCVGHIGLAVGHFGHHRCVPMLSVPFEKVVEAAANVLVHDWRLHWSKGALGQRSFGCLARHDARPTRQNNYNVAWKTQVVMGKEPILNTSSPVPRLVYFCGQDGRVTFWLSNILVSQRLWQLRRPKYNSNHREEPRSSKGLLLKMQREWENQPLNFLVPGGLVCHVPLQFSCAEVSQLLQELSSQLADDAKVGRLTFQRRSNA